MRIGYPCINLSLSCRASRTFRLASYTPGRLRETVAGNLECLGEILRWNAAHGVRHFRITSDLVPFASHPVMDVPWQREFASTFRELGDYARREAMRLSLHPDQFVLLNAPDEKIFGRSVDELIYQAEMLDLMGTGPDARLQLHVGGVYNDREGSLGRFVERWPGLPEPVRRRLAIENDERLWGPADLLRLHESTGVPLVLDSLHLACRPDGFDLRRALGSFARTWENRVGPPMVDYSSQAPGARRGAHAASLDPTDFRLFLDAAAGFDPDVMLEIKDKESSCLAALAMLDG